MDTALTIVSWLPIFACLEEMREIAVMLGGIILFLTPLAETWWPLATKSRDAGLVYFAATYWIVMFAWMFLQPQIVIKLF